MQSVIIAVDFDGTIVEHAFPQIGAPVPGAIYWLQQFQAAGARLILWTIRSDDDKRHTLSDAVEYCTNRDIMFWGVNDNPGQYTWSQSPKAYAHLYIDDAAVGCPLIHPVNTSRRPYVDWTYVGPAVMAYINSRATVTRFVDAALPIPDRLEDPTALQTINLPEVDA